MHIRSGHLEDHPFVELDPETCKVKDNFTPWTSQDDLLKWSKTDVQSTIGDSDTGFRYLRPIPLHKEDGITTFKGSKQRRHDYLNRGMLHKNAQHIIFHSGKNIHVFDR